MEPIEKHERKIVRIIAAKCARCGWTFCQQCIHVPERLQRITKEIAHSTGLQCAFVEYNRKFVRVQVFRWKANIKTGTDPIDENQKHPSLGNQLLRWTIRSVFPCDYSNWYWNFNWWTIYSTRFRWLCHIAETEKTEPPTVRATVSTEKSEVVGEIRDMLLCNDEEAAMIYYNHLSDSEQLESAETNISYLNRNQFDNRTIVDNPFLLTMDLGTLNSLHSNCECRHRD